MRLNSHLLNHTAKAVYRTQFSACCPILRIHVGRKNILLKQKSIEFGAASIIFVMLKPFSARSKNNLAYLQLGRRRKKER